MNETNKKTTIRDLWQLFLIVMIPIICVSGVSTIPFNLRTPFIYAVGIMFVLVFVFSDIKIHLTAVTILAFLLISYMGLSLFYSYNPETTRTLFLWYVCLLTLLFIDMPHNCYEKILTVMYVFCAVIALSIILSAFVENCMLNYFSFFINPTHSPDVVQTVKRELSYGAYSGLARERAEAAYIMNVGIAILFARYFSEGKLAKRDMFFLVVFLIALMLTGKRTLFIVVIVCFAIYMVISKVKSKFFKIACIAILAVCAFLLIMAFVPKLAHIFDRLMDENNIETMGDRDMLWNYLYLMISKYPLFGAGFGSYNKFAYNNGLLVGGLEWKYNGHNSYLQALGELGAIGAGIFALLVIAALVISFKMLKANLNNPKNSYLVYFSIYIQLLLLIYSVTGNPIYSKQMMFCWFFSVGMVLFVQRSTKLSAQPNAEIKNRRLVRYE